MWGNAMATDEHAHQTSAVAYDWFQSSRTVCSCHVTHIVLVCLFGISCQIPHEAAATEASGLTPVGFQFQGSYLRNEHF